jgi:hypothetical protein
VARCGGSTAWVDRRRIGTRHSQSYWSGGPYEVDFTSSLLVWLLVAGYICSCLSGQYRYLKYHVNSLFVSFESIQSHRGRVSQCMYTTGWFAMVGPEVGAGAQLAYTARLLSAGLGGLL